jgi:hypothetical protein
MRIAAGLRMTRQLEVQHTTSATVSWITHLTLHLAASSATGKLIPLANEAAAKRPPHR